MMISVLRNWKGCGIMKAETAWTADERMLQYRDLIVLKMQSCKTGVDIAELIKEAEDFAVEDYKRKVREAWNKFLAHDIGVDDFEKELGL